MPKRWGISGRVLSMVVLGVVAALSCEHPAVAMEAEARSEPSVSDGAPPRAVSEVEQIAWSTWLGHLAEAAREKGVRAATVEAALKGLEPDTEIIARLQTQPEFTRSAGDYVTRAVSERRLEMGREMLDRHAQLLEQLEAAYGVDRHALVAIWGLESTYGTGKGDKSVVRSLATLAYQGGRRMGYGRRQLFAALEILDAGDIAPAEFVGSWAGAMGHTQFIPTTYQAFAVDFDKDGRRDIWGSEADALASTAHYLAKTGWRKGVRWGGEVVLPEGFDYALTGRKSVKPLTDWQKLGVRFAAAAGADGQADAGAIILPSGARGPAFFVSGNFNAILRYNFSTSYALAIGHLADRLAGLGPLKQGWPENDVALSAPERLRLQQFLVDLGYDTGGIDGILGTKSRQAIRAFQAKAGLVVDGHPNKALLDRVEKQSDFDG